MATDEYAGREKAFNQSLGSVIGGYAVAAVEADSLAKNAQLKRNLEVLGLDNIDFNVETGLVGYEEKLTMGLNIPPIAIMDNRPIVVGKATLDMSMKTSAHTEDGTEREAGGEASGSASVGFGMFKASATFKAHASVHSSQKRSSDYSATTDVHIEMVQGDVPEGLATILDCVSRMVERSTLINERLIDSKANQIAASQDEAATAA